MTPSAAVEALRDLHRVLAGHPVGHEQDLVGMHRVLQAAQLVHHVLVDLQPARGVDDDHAIARAPRLLDAGARDLHDVLRRRDRRTPGRRAACRASRAGRSRRDGTRRAAIEARLPSLALQLARELGGGGRLARALQPDQHDDRRRDGAELEPLAPLAEHRGELVVDDLDELLRRARPCAAARRRRPSSRRARGTRASAGS